MNRYKKSGLTFVFLPLILIFICNLNFAQSRGHDHYPIQRRDVQLWYVVPQPINANAFGKGNYFIKETPAFKRRYIYFPPGTDIKFSNDHAALIKKQNIYELDIYLGDVKRSKIKHAVLTSNIIYDSSGRPIAYNFFHEKSIHHRYLLYYDAKGKLVREIDEPVNGNTDKTIYEFEYNSNGNEVMRYISNADTSEIVMIKTTYDENNNKIQVSKKLNNENYIDINFYKYDSLNRLIENLVYNESERGYYKHTYEYDAATNSKKMYAETDSLKILENEYIYNASNQLIQIINHPEYLPDSFHWLDGTLILSPGSNKQKILGTYINYNTDGTMAEQNYSIGEKIYRNNTYVYLKR